jgi:mersacidin/lichenicidin family type 2 lantibiotic
MSNLDIIRAWKDEEYRSSLSETELAQLPKNPVGMVELSDDELDLAAGGRTEILMSMGCCQGITSHCDSPTQCGTICTWMLCW